MTYQAASGAGAQNMRELVAQMGAVRQAAGGLLDDPAASILDIDRAVASAACAAMRCRTSTSVPRLPAACCRGSTRIWATARAVRSGRRRPKATRSSGASAIRSRWTVCACASERCAATARRSPSSSSAMCRLPTSRAILAGANRWVKVIPNQREASLRALTPAAVTGTLEVPDRAAAQAEHGRRVPGRLHGRRSAAVGRCGAAPAHAAHSAGGWAARG